MKPWLAPLGASRPGLLPSETGVAGKKPTAASLFAITTALSLSGIIATPGVAAAVPPVSSFQFTTTVDATALGGDAAAPLRILYQYSPDLAAGSGPLGESETFASYGPLEKVIIEVGDQCVSLSGDGTAITVFNNAGPDEDSIDVRADAPATAGKQLFGLDFLFTRFLLADSAGTMFTSTALPTSPDFAEEADIQQTQIDLVDPVTGEGSGLIPAGDAPYALTTFDPPAQIEAILEDVRALQVRGSLIKQLAAPLEEARAALAGTLTQRNLSKGVQQLQRFINLVNANRRTLGDATADSLAAPARETIDSLPACG